MNCLTCPHLVVSDWEEDRDFRCGHPVGMELDSNSAAPVIYSVAWKAVDDCGVLVNGPAWCPREDLEKPLEIQKELFE